MLIGIMSDSHSHCMNIRQAVKIFNKHKISRCLHAGDIMTPHTWIEFKKLECPIDFAFGNNDRLKDQIRDTFSDKCTFHDGKFNIAFNNKNFLVMHEPIALDEIENIRKYDCIIYGHTHCVDIRTETGILIINPGEVCGYRSGTASVIILEIPSMKTKLITLRESKEVDIFT